MVSAKFSIIPFLLLVTVVCGNKYGIVAINGLTNGFSNGNGLCPRVQSCRPGQAFDLSRCRCICLNQVSSCHGAAIYNSHTCRCECSVRPLCDQYQVVNENYCRCDPLYPGGIPPSLLPAFGQVGSVRIVGPQLVRPLVRPVRPNRFNRLLRPGRLGRRRCPNVLCNENQKLNRHTCECECRQVYATVEVPLPRRIQRYYYGGVYYPATITPPTIRRQRLIPAPCPSGTTLDKNTCICQD
jgi:hypothetical protein